MKNSQYYTDRKSSTAQLNHLHTFRFDGVGRELFKIMFVNFLLTVFTLGVYCFWAKTRTRQYIWSHISLGEQRLSYNGTGLELLIGWLKFIGVYLGLALGVALLSQLGKPVQYLTGAFLFAVGLVIFPYALYASRNYRLTRTRLNGQFFGMSADIKGYVLSYLKWRALQIVSLGLTTPWVDNNLHKALKERTYYGRRPFRFSGKGGDLSFDFFLAMALVPLTLGLYYPWYKARALNYRAGHTHFGHAKMVMNLSGSELLAVLLGSLLLVLLTFGLATPWVICLVINFFCERCSLVGPLDLSGTGSQAKAGTGFDEALAGALDVG